MGPLQFCLPIFLGIHRNPKQNEFFTLRMWDNPIYSRKNSHLTSDFWVGRHVKLHLIVTNQMFGRTSTVRFGPNDRTFFCRTQNFFLYYCIFQNGYLRYFKLALYVILSGGDNFKQSSPAGLVLEFEMSVLIIVKYTVELKRQINLNFGILWHTEV